MIDELYQKNILRHAAEACRSGHLTTPHAQATVQSPLCGDRITIELHTRGDQITDLGYTTRSCVLCQASASILGEVAIGRTIPEIAAARAALAHMLTSPDAAPAWPAKGWEALNVFTPVAEHRNRHTCVTLPFDALARAFETAEDQTPPLARD